MERLERIASSHGWIGDDVPVLPFYFRETRYIAEGITFINHLVPYVIRSRRGQIQGAATPTTGNFLDEVLDFRPEDWEVDGLQGVLNALRELYRDGADHDLIKFSAFNSLLKAAWTD